VRAILILTAIAVAVLAAPSAAAPPFDASTLAPHGDAPVEAMPYAYDLAIRSTDETIGADIEVAIPPAALWLGIEGLAGVAHDEDGRSVRWQGELPAGETRVRVHLLAGRAAGGQMSTLRVTLRPWQGEPTYLSHMAEVDTRPARAVVSVGRIGVSAAGVAVLAWLLVGAVTWLLLRVLRPDAAAWVPFAVVLPLAFLSYFAWLAREDVRILRLPATTCAVRDRVLDSRTTSSNTSPRRGPQTVYQPRVAVSYARSGEVAYAQGFGTDSRLSRGSSVAAGTPLAAFTIGATVPCAIDDRDPTRVYVERGFGGAYVFALIPLPVLALGVWAVRMPRTRRIRNTGRSAR